jgi:hypothetical protein
MASRTFTLSNLTPSELEAFIVSAFRPKWGLHRVYFGEILVCQKED